MAEGNSVVCVTNFVDAIILMVFFYFVFWIEYPVQSRCSFLFLQEKVLQRSSADCGGKVPVKLIRFYEKLIASQVYS